MALALCVLSVAAGVLWLRRKERRLITIRDQCVRNSEQKYAGLLDTAAHQHLHEMVRQLRDQIRRATQQLLQFEVELDGMQGRLSKQQRHPLASSSPFRLSAIDRTALDWAYRRWRQAPQEMRRPVIEEQGLFSGWQVATSEILLSRLLAYSRRLFAPIQRLSLYDIWRHRADDPSRLLSTLKHGAVPLLRPSFDRLGGGGYAFASQYIVRPEDGDDPVNPESDETHSDWETWLSSDPYVLTCCRVRYLIPLDALITLKRQAHKSYQELDPQEQQALALLDGWANFSE